MSDCCLSGKVHSGSPKGKEEEIGGIPVYTSTPQNGSKEKSVIFIVDSMMTPLHRFSRAVPTDSFSLLVFGWKFTNTRLLADMVTRDFCP